VRVEHLHLLKPDAVFQMFVRSWDRVDLLTECRPNSEERELVVHLAGLGMHLTGTAVNLAGGEGQWAFEVHSQVPLGDSEGEHQLCCPLMSALHLSLHSTLISVKI
jgi:hypothetical protein